jgi:hypothetical protein
MRVHLTALLVAALCACDAGFLMLDRDLSQPASCNAETPCAPGLRCIHHVCSDDVTAFSKVLVSVVHNNSTQQFTNVDLSERPVCNLALSEERSVGGVVQTTAGKGIESVVVATLDDSIPGEAVRRTARTDDDGAFTLKLTRGKGWSLRALPVGRELPPSAIVHVGGVQLDRSASGTNLVLELPNHDAYWRVHGRLMDFAGTPLETRPPIDNPGAPDTDPNRAKLRLLDVEGRRWGNPIDTDSAGNFSFLLPPDTHQISLLLEGAELTKPAVLLGEHPISSADHDLGQIILPGPTVVKTATIQARAPTDGHSVACTLRLRPLAADGLVQFEAHTLDGEITQLSLTEGRYAVDFLPPEHSGFGPILNVTLDTSSAGPDGLHASVELPRLVEVNGTLKLQDGLPGMGATVFLEQRLGNLPNARLGALGSHTIKRSVAVADDGSFTAHMPAGRTSITAVPVSPYPRLIDERTLEHGIDIRLTVGHPVFFTGQVNGNQSEAGLPMALLRVFSDTLEVDGKKVMIGETITDAHGSFSITLPTIQSDTE